MTTRVAVVTDSTASLPAALVEATGIVVVPLEVVIDGVPYREGVDLSPARLVEALLAGATVTTSQPGPAAFARVYARMAARGAQEIVSIHLSGALSSTVTTAELAAQSAGVPVHVVDSRTVAMGLGLAVLAAAHTASGSDVGTGGRDAPGPGPVTGASVARAAEVRASGSTVLFAVDSLEHLRRGGRLGAVAAALGTVLGLRPVLGVRSGHLEVVEKVRTSARARERLVDLAAADIVRRRRADVAVHHLGQPEMAVQVEERLRAAGGTQIRTVHVVEVSAVLAAHVGPGLIAVVVADA
ncbi:MAG: DegV family protein [Actinotalea sp.]|nr:DegV family protein [Actinotalea sp.]